MRTAWLLGLAAFGLGALSAQAQAPTTGAHTRPRAAQTAPKAVQAKPAPPHETISHGRFGQVALYRPERAVTSVVLFLSGDGGWNLGVVDMAKALTDQGALVAGINVPKWLAALETETSACVSPDADLEDLSHYLQAYVKLPTYHVPVLVGYSSGATLAYAMLVEAPVNTFAGGIALGFCPDLELEKPMCAGEGLRFTRRKDHGVDFLPAKLGNPLTVLHGTIDQVCNLDSTREFLMHAQNATLVTLPKVGHGYSVPRNWMPQYLEAYRSVVDNFRAALPPPPSSLNDLPLVEVPAHGGGDLFAVLLSGDGGWAGLDKAVAAGLAAHGVPVVGVDSLRYFWNARTPEGLATDLDRVLRYYAAHWSAPHALLVGYSQGADVLPFALNRLPEATRSTVVRTVLIGPSDTASFEFHFTNWLEVDSGGLPTLPELARVDTPVLCLSGREETHSPCTRAPPGHVQTEVLPGGHHFAGAYDSLATRILAGLGRG